MQFVSSNDHSLIIIECFESLICCLCFELNLLIQIHFNHFNTHHNLLPYLRKCTYFGKILIFM